MDPAPFFAYARERQSILLRRRAGLPRSAWTQDPILQQYRFCNVYREDDRTTEWFRTNVRDPLRNQPEVLLATVLFRWFNRISTGEQIFSQTDLGYAPPATAWEVCLATRSVDPLRSAIRGKGPFVTGSYIIKTPDGMSKPEGVLWCVEQFMTRKQMYTDASGYGPMGEDVLAELLHSHARIGSSPATLEGVWLWLCQFPFLGPFMAYEIVTDLRHTALLENAPDISTWANPGPGAMRGLNRLHGRPLNFRQPKERFIEEMRELLVRSGDARYWPQFDRRRPDLVSVSLPASMSAVENVDLLVEHDWRPWEMREVEHTLCEWDKYERARTGEGRPRQVFR